MGMLLHKDMHAQSSVYVADVSHISYHMQKYSAMCKHMILLFWCCVLCCCYMLALFYRAAETANIYVLRSCLRHGTHISGMETKILVASLF